MLTYVRIAYVVVQVAVLGVYFYISQQVCSYTARACELHPHLLLLLSGQAKERPNRSQVWCAQILSDMPSPRLLLMLPYSS